MDITMAITDGPDGVGRIAGRLVCRSCGGRGGRAMPEGDWWLLDCCWLCCCCCCGLWLAWAAAAACFAWARLYSCIIHGFIMNGPVSIIKKLITVENPSGPKWENERERKSSYDRRKTLHPRLHRHPFVEQRVLKIFFHYSKDLWWSKV